MLYGLSGSLWPIHIKPLPGELFSSWLIRFAHAHGYKVQTMCLLLFGRDQPIWTRDLDKLVPDSVKKVMLEATGATEDQFTQSTLRSYEGILYEKVNPNRSSRWILPVGVFHRKRRRPGLMYCAMCLRDDSIPYFRKKWRLACSTVCTIHNVELIECCPFCQSPIAPHRVDVGGYQPISEYSLISRCFQCRKLLHEFLPKSANSEIIQIQKQFELTMSNGYVDWGANATTHSLAYFDGLRAMIAGLTSKKVMKKLEKIELFSEFNRVQFSKSGFEFASLEARSQMVRILSLLSKDWPDSFIRLIRDGNLLYSDLRGEIRQLPYWYEDLLRRESFRGLSKFSPDYVESIVSATERKYGKFSGGLARQISGRDITSHSHRCRYLIISDDLYRDLLVSLDHEIASSMNEQVRLELIRDKVMFIVGRIFGLTTTDLANFTLNQCQILAPRKEELSFFQEPESIEQARAWTEWFFKNILPMYHPAKDEGRIFLSIKTHRALKKSAISHRFIRAVDAANLNGDISSYALWKRRKG